MIPSALWLALISALLVYRDARRHHVPHAPAWAGAVLIFWIAALPCYIWQRRRRAAAAL